MASRSRIMCRIMKSVELFSFQLRKPAGLVFKNREISHSRTLHEEYKSSESVINTTDEVDGSVGVERWELLQRVKGIDDPFQLSAKTVPAGTKDKPTLVPTISNQRTVGCICRPNSPIIKWMRLGVGETKCCECGHWFKLVPLEE